MSLSGKDSVVKQLNGIKRQKQLQQVIKNDKKKKKKKKKKIKK